MYVNGRGDGGSTCVCDTYMLPTSLPMCSLRSVRETMQRIMRAVTMYRTAIRPSSISSRKDRDAFVMKIIRASRFSKRFPNKRHNQSLLPVPTNFMVVQAGSFVLARGLRLDRQSSVSYNRFYNGRRIFDLLRTR